MYSAWQSLPWCCKTVCRLFHQWSSICTLCCHTYSGGGQPVRMGMYPDISHHLENRLRHAGCSSVLRMIKLSFTASGNWHELDRAIILLIRRQPEFLRPESERKKGIGKALLLKSLESMRELGYAYAIIIKPILCRKLKQQK